MAFYITEYFISLGRVQDEETIIPNTGQGGWVLKFEFLKWHFQHSMKSTHFFLGGGLSCVKDFDELMLYWVLLHAMQKLYTVLQK